MASARSLAIVAVAAVIALFALVLSSNSPVSETPTALAGPCGADPWLHKEEQSPSADPIKKIRVFISDGDALKKYLAVDTIPPELPPGKPDVTVTVDAVNGHPGIDVTFSPDDSDGSFNTKMRVRADGVPPGMYTYKITLFCHTQTYEVELEVWVDQCPVENLPAYEFDTSADRQISRQIAGPTEEPDFPDECAGSEETPAPSPSPSPTPSMPPSETPLSLDDLWGDSDCSGEVNPIDSLKTLRTDAGDPPVQDVPFCPAWNAFVRWLSSLNSRAGAQGGDIILRWGDGDCSDSVDPIDSLKILRTDAGLGVDQPDDCPDMNEEIQYELVEQ
jgi:hypothetical protein